MIADTLKTRADARARNSLKTYAKLVAELAAGADPDTKRDAAAIERVLDAAGRSPQDLETDLAMLARATEAEAEAALVMERDSSFRAIRAEANSIAERLAETVRQEHTRIENLREQQRLAEVALNRSREAARLALEARGKWAERLLPDANSRLHSATSRVAVAETALGVARRRLTDIDRTIKEAGGADERAVDLRRQEREITLQRIARAEFEITEAKAALDIVEAEVEEVTA